MSRLSSIIERRPIVDLRILWWSTSGFFDGSRPLRVRFAVFLISWLQYYGIPKRLWAWAWPIIDEYERQQEAMDETREDDSP